MNASQDNKSFTWVCDYCKLSRNNRSTRGLEVQKNSLALENVS